MAALGDVYRVRHGETERRLWPKHTGMTDFRADRRGRGTGTSPSRSAEL
jgi:hypothetical protein